MKRLLIMIMGISLVFCGSVSAAPAYGTKMPAKKEFFLGLQEYFVKHRDLEHDHGHIRSRQDSLTLSYGLMEWLALDLKVSTGTFSRFSTSGDETRYTHSVFGGGYGFRIKAYESGPTKAVVGFHHYSLHPNLLETNGERVRSYLEEWQGSALVSYDLKHFTPYTGLRYSGMGYVMWSRVDKHTGMKSPEDQRLGLVLGSDIPLTDRVWINLEADGQGIEDVGLSAALNCRF